MDIISSRLIKKAEGDPWNFQTPKVELIVQFRHVSPVSLNWQCYVDAREWGIKDLSIVVPDQTISYVEENEESGESQDKTFLISRDNVKITRSEGHGISPVSIEVYNDEVEITFS